MIYPEIPVKAISIMQPWAWLIVNGHKDIENRDWPTKFRGPVAIHAGKKIDDVCALELDQFYHPVSGRRVEFVPKNKGIVDVAQIGGIVGVAEIVDCVDNSESEWFVGKFGFVIRNAKPVDFIPVKGSLSFFDWRKNL